MTSIKKAVIMVFAILFAGGSFIPTDAHAGFEAYMACMINYNSAANRCLQYTDQADQIGCFSQLKRCVCTTSSGKVGGCSLEGWTNDTANTLPDCYNCMDILTHSNYHNPSCSNVAPLQAVANAPFSPGYSLLYSTAASGYSTCTGIDSLVAVAKQGCIAQGYSCVSDVTVYGPVSLFPALCADLTNCPPQGDNTGFGINVGTAQPSVCATVWDGTVASGPGTYMNTGFANWGANCGNANPSGSYTFNYGSPFFLKYDPNNYKLYNQLANKQGYKACVSQSSYPYFPENCLFHEQGDPTIYPQADANCVSNSATKWCKAFCHSNTAFAISAVPSTNPNTGTTCSVSTVVNKNKGVCSSTSNIVLSHTNQLEYIVTNSAATPDEYARPVYCTTNENIHVPPNANSIMPMACDTVPPTVNHNPMNPSCESLGCYSDASECLAANHSSSTVSSPDYTVTCACHPMTQTFVYLNNWAASSPGSVIVDSPPMNLSPGYPNAESLPIWPWNCGSSPVPSDPLTQSCIKSNALPICQSLFAKDNATCAHGITVASISYTKSGTGTDTVNGTTMSFSNALVTCACAQ
jgi:hypothetical protein